MELITTHINADFDAFASMVAAKKLYPEAEAAFPGSQEKKLREFMDSFHPFPVRRVRDIDLSAVTRLIVVDTKSPDRLGPFAELLSRPGLDVHVYDHHPREDGDIRGSMEVLEKTGAVSTIFTGILRDKGIKPTPMEATILCLGIYEETGNLLYPSTTERDVEAVAWLLRCGASLNIVSTYVKTELSVDELDALNALTHSARELVVGGLRVVIAKATRERYLGDAAHLAHRLMDMEYTDAAVIMLSMEGKVLIVGRSRAPELNVAEVLEEFGGGGHPTAASATIRDIPLEILEEKLVSAINENIKPGKFAVDVMTTPVITIDSGSTIKDAESMMTRYGVNVLPVERKGEYKGIISREVVEKAIYHGLRESPVMDFATTDAITAERYTPIAEVEAQMIEQNQRFMPVVEEGAIKGAITRTDLLRSMYEEHLRRSHVRAAAAEERMPTGKSLASWIQSKLPPRIYRLLTAAGETAAPLGFGAYLVGGSVRDMLRGEENLDMDIVIEGDGIAFAKEFAKRLGARVHPHERFGTAKLVTPDGFKLDIASARTEYYESPAALPVVQVSSIKKDLYRRDFTINTLALKLNPGEMGRLVDFFGGQRDIKEKTIRVLHNLSFVEDPTRAFRAFRFAERFGFRISKHTQNLIRSALKMDLFDKLSGSRLYEELLLIFQEKDPTMVIKSLSDFGLLKVVHQNLSLTERLYEILGAVHDTLLWFDLLFTEEQPEKHRIYLMALVSELDDHEKEKALERIAVPPRVKRQVIGGIQDAGEALKRMPRKDPARIYEALSRLGLETLLYAMALTRSDEKKKEISHYLQELRKTATIITGDDLKRMGVPPGPVYAKLLEETLMEKLRGKLTSREEEEEFVRKRMKKVRHGR